MWKERVNTIEPIHYYYIFGPTNVTNHLVEIPHQKVTTDYSLFLKSCCGKRAMFLHLLQTILHAFTIVIHSLKTWKETVNLIMFTTLMMVLCIKRGKYHHSAITWFFVYFSLLQPSSEFGVMLCSLFCLD